MTTTDKGKYKATFDKKLSGGGDHASVQCYMCGVISHYANECSSVEKKSYKCGKIGHPIAECKGNVVT